MSIPLAESSLLYSSLACEPDFRDLVEMFVGEMPGRTARYRDCLAAQDWDGLRCAAHHLKGSAGSYGFDQLTPYAAHLESLVDKKASLDEIATAVEVLSGQCGRVTAVVPK